LEERDSLLGHGPLEVEILEVAKRAHRSVPRWIRWCASRQRDVTGGEEALDTVIAGFAVDIVGVVVFSERPKDLVATVRPTAQKVVEDALPASLVDAGRVADDTVHVEDHHIEPIDREEDHSCRL
jgi:hypothetical protein